MKKSSKYHHSPPNSYMVFSNIAFIAIALAIAGCVPWGANSAIEPEKKISASSVEILSSQTWQDRWNKSISESKKEGKIVIYTSMGPEARIELAKAYKDKFGIELEFLSGRGPEISRKLFSEVGAGLYLADTVITAATTAINVIKPGGFVQSLDSLIILPELKDSRIWRNERIPFLDKEHKILSLIAGYRSYVIINSNIVKDGEIKSYLDLLNPKWKGKIVLDDPTDTGSGNQFLTETLSIIWDMERGRSFIQSLVKQEPVLSRDRRLELEWVAQGKYPIGLGTQRETVSDFIDKGAPIKWVRVVEGGSVSAGSGTIMVINKPAHPGGAMVFLNWLLTREGQTAMVNGFGSPSTRVDVSTAGLDPFTIPQPGERINWPDEEFYLSKPRLTEIIKELFTPLIK